jgi:replicative superfamily II helicase
MSDKDDDFQPEEAWDEYVWERFLQEQDRNTEKYFALLETYMDHPNRDEIIAEQMGWSVFEAAETADEDTEDCETPEFLLEEEEEEADDEFEEFTQSAVYADTLRLHKWINRLFDSREDLREHPEAVRFATRSAICGAKLAAALCGQEQTEIGMTIAYLKRALKAANDSLDALQILADTGILDRRRANHGRRLVFSIRNCVVDQMREYRRLWTERHGR